MGRLFSEHLLTVVVFLPALAAALLLLLFRARSRRRPRSSPSSSRSRTASCPCRSGPGSTSAQKGFQFREQVDWIPAARDLLLARDRRHLAPARPPDDDPHAGRPALLADARREGGQGFSIAFLLLETGMLGSLVALDLALFYVFWEVMLVPMYFIIGIWGGPRRIYAAMKFFLFTMAGSLLMFLAILYIAIRHQAATGRLVVRPRGPLPAELHRAGRDAPLRRLRSGLRDQGPRLPAPHLAAGRPHGGARRRARSSSPASC